MMKNVYLQEAFKALDILNEEDFNLSSVDGLKDAKEFIDTDEKSDFIDIIDPEAETEEEIKDSYVGDVILDCCVCHSKLYKHPDEVNISEEANLANIDEECPFCYSTDGYEIIGMVAPYEEEEDEEVEIDDEEEVEDGVVESFKRKRSKKLNEGIFKVGRHAGDSELLFQSVDDLLSILNRIKSESGNEEFCDPYILNHLGGQLAFQEAGNIDMSMLKNRKTLSGKDAIDKFIDDWYGEYEAEDDDEFDESFKRKRKLREAYNKKTHEFNMLRRELYAIASGANNDIDSIVNPMIDDEGYPEDFYNYPDKYKDTQEFKNFYDEIKRRFMDKFNTSERFTEFLLEYFFLFPMKDFDIKSNLTDQDKNYIYGDEDDEDEVVESFRRKRKLKEEFSEEIWNKLPSPIKNSLNVAWDSNKSSKWFDAYLTALVDADILDEKDKKEIIQSNIEDGFEDEEVEEGLGGTLLGGAGGAALGGAALGPLGAIGGAALGGLAGNILTKNEELNEDADISEYQKWVDYDMKKYGRISRLTIAKIKKAGFSVVKDQYGDYEVIADRKDESCEKSAKFVNNRKNSIVRGDDDPGYDEYDFDESLNEEDEELLKEYRTKGAKNKMRLEIAGKPYSAIFAIQKDGLKYAVSAKKIKNIIGSLDYIYRDDWEDDDKIQDDYFLYVNGRAPGHIFELDERHIEDVNELMDYISEAFSLVNSGKYKRAAVLTPDENILVDYGTAEEFAAFNESLSSFKSRKKSKKIKEHFEKVEIETDKEKMEMTSEPNGKTIITTEPKNSDEEMIVPVSDEVQSEINPINEPDEPNEDEFADIEVDEFSEDEFNELGESYLKKVYENVNSFKTSEVKTSGNKLVVEGIIGFNSGKQKKTSFVFESKDVNKKGKVRFIGENLQLSRGKKAFTVTGKINEGKFIAESLNYNYRTKDSTGKSTRLYGTVRTNK